MRHNTRNEKGRFMAYPRPRESVDEKYIREQRLISECLLERDMANKDKKEKCFIDKIIAFFNDVF